MGDQPLRARVQSSHKSPGEETWPDSRQAYPMMAIGCGVRVSPSHGVPLDSAVPFMIVVVEDEMMNERHETVEGD